MIAGVEIDGRRVLLTGASGGLGRAIARALHARGAVVVASGRNAGALEELGRELGGERLETAPADLANGAEVADLVERAGRVDVLVANAAVPASGRLETLDPERIDRGLDVNLRAPMQLARALVPAMLERREGHLVFVSSLNGKAASGGGSVYCATKFGMRGFASALRDELHGTGVGVTTIFPGFIREAGMWAETGLSLPRGVSTRSPADVAAAVVRGIERDRGEIDVAPVALRVAALVSGIAPEAIATVSRRMGSGSLSDAMAEAQREKT